MSLDDRLHAAAVDTAKRIGDLAPPPLRSHRTGLKVAIGFAALVGVIVGLAGLFETGDSAPTLPPVAPPTTVSTEVELGATVFPVASYVPDGFDLAIVGADYTGPGGHAYFLPSGVDVVTEQDPFLASITFRTRSTGLYTQSFLQSAFEAAGVADVTETIIRNRPALYGADPSGTVFLVLVEDPKTFTEVSGYGVNLDELVEFAESLTFVSWAAYDAHRLEQVSWDLEVSGAAAGGTAATVAALEAVPGVAEVRLVVGVNSRGRLFRFLLNPEEEPVPVTTTSAPTDGSPVDVGTSFTAFLQLAPGAIATDVATLLMESKTVYGVELSPKIARQDQDRVEGMVAAGTVLQSEPLVVQAPSSPDPTFDTTTLGTEVLLSPAVPGDQLDLPDQPWIGDEPNALGNAVVVHLGALQDGGRLYLQLYDSGFFFITYLDKDLGSSTGGGEFAEYSYGVAGGSWGPSGAFVDVKVPLETAIVVLNHGEETLWQRPVLGYGVFPVENLNGLVEVIALDAAGDEIGRWLDTME